MEILLDTEEYTLYNLSFYYNNFALVFIISFQSFFENPSLFIPNFFTSSIQYLVYHLIICSPLPSLLQRH